jgi:hypothetical protein
MDEDVAANPLMLQKPLMTRNPSQKPMKISQTPMAAMQKRVPR